MLKFELKRLLAPRANQISLLVFLFSALLAVFLGTNAYKEVRKDQVIAKIVFEKERAHLKDKGDLPEMGSLAYYAKAPTQWYLSPWAALFTGQSQNNLAAMKVNALALQGQIYNKEVINPSKHRAGGFDLGFVLAYMLPILIGILCVNLLSDERQSGRFTLLSAFAGNAAKKTIIRSLLLRFYIVAGIVLLLFLASAVLLSLPFDRVFIAVLGLTLAYSGLWFLIAAAIISLNMSGLFNSLAFVSIWLVFSVLIPGAIHLGLNQQYTEQPALRASIEQRLILNDGWDQDMQTALTRFSEQYPQYRDKLDFQGRFHWKWYYAMQNLSDLAVDNHWQAYLQLQQARENSLSKVSWLSPNLLYQQALNQFSGTDTQAYQAYLMQVSAYHKQVSEFIYPYLFNDTPVTNSDLDLFPEFQPIAEPVRTKGLYYSTGLFVLLCGLFTAMTTIRFKRLAVI
jgi:ABC-2 type transport system permease protein